MLFLVKLFPEITIKSRSVRRRLVRLLRRNIKSVLRRHGEQLRVSGEWDLIEVEIDTPDAGAEVLEKLRLIPGIARIAEVDKHPLPDFDGILAIAKAHYGDALAGKTFAVRCKRSGRHAFRSVDVEVFVGAGLLRETAAAGVDLGNPEVLVALEIRHEELFVVAGNHAGLGGFPIGGQGAVLSLISGGFDSAVSSYLVTRRGLQTHYCFFNLGGDAHRLAVRELALYLWLRYHSSHRVKFVTVPFEDVVREILERVDNPQMGVVLKRMMLRAADRIARDVGAEALVTGESIAQVSSQTLANLAVIDSVAESLVIRPLATVDKQRIIDLAREIGTEEFSSSHPRILRGDFRQADHQGKAETGRTRGSPLRFRRARQSRRRRLVPAHHRRRWRREPCGRSRRATSAGAGRHRDRHPPRVGTICRLPAACRSRRRGAAHSLLSPER